jgi:hypothetical protein
VARVVVAGCGAAMVVGRSTFAGVIAASSSSAIVFLNDLMPLAKSPISVLTLPLPNSSRTTISTTIQCQMLKLPMIPPDARHAGLAAAHPP